MRRTAIPGFVNHQGRPGARSSETPVTLAIRSHMYLATFLSVISS
ncbi:hypothetical protein ABZT02_42335 [Streptomyces sp. NPDC005402]